MIKRSSLVSVYIIYAFVTAGFLGILVFEGVVDKGGVDGATIIVDKQGGGDHTTIQAAINAAKSGDTIEIWAGTYFENVAVNKQVTIIGNGTTNTTINGGGTGDVIYVTAGSVKIENLKVTNSGTLSNNAGINVYQADNCIIRNCNSSNNNRGIVFVESNYFYTFNNSCYNNNIGFRFKDSDWGEIENNTCDSNLEWGIICRSSRDNNLKNNTIVNSGESGIYLLWSYDIVLLNNSMINCGILIGGSQLLDWRNFNIDINNTVNGKPVYYWKDSSSGKIPNDAGEVILANCQNIYVENLNLSDCAGVQLGFSDNNHIKNNTLTNTYIGITLEDSGSNIIQNNNCSNNKNSGIFISDDSYNNLIVDNVCNFNSIGEYTPSGIYLSYCSFNTVKNNTCNHNLFGIHIDNFAGSNKVQNNICNQNKYGILTYSGPTIVENNTFNSNSDGIIIPFAGGNLIKNNSISGNSRGIYFRDGADDNTIINNTISNNDIGINISSSSNNVFYYNNIIDNTVQAFDDSSNTWDNGNDKEGNYWSDYTGVDNGANMRPQGDGIGDTEIPHLGLDNYPFTEKSGWLIPSTPTLGGPIDLVTNGSYLLNWQMSYRAKNYILEEDLSGSFNSPKEVYNGTNLSFKFNQKNNGTFYYRVRASNDHTVSDWSNIISVEVDWIPKAPFNLTVKHVGGNDVTLSWDADIEPDIVGYKISINDTGADATGHFHIIHVVNNKNTTEYKVTNLAEEIEYYFKVNAFDKNSNSTNSNIAYARTLDITPPKKPLGLKANAINNNEIKLTWKPSLDLDLAGYLIFMNDTGSGISGSYKIINQTEDWVGSYTVTNLVEQTTYHFKLKAFDEVPNNSTFSEVASAITPDLIKPTKPTGLSVAQGPNLYECLTLYWNKNPEPDVVGYDIYRSQAATSGFEKVNNAVIINTSYSDCDLMKGTEYFYKLKAVDDADLESEFSEVGSNTTKFSYHYAKPSPDIEDFSIPEDTYDDHSINLYEWFTDEYFDKLEFGCKDQDHITVTIFNENGTVILQPEHNWNGRDTMNFSAKNGYNVTTFVMVTITVVAVNDPPQNARIIVKNNKTTIYMNEVLNLEGDCEDPDIPYGEELTYKWTSYKMGELGSKRTLVLSKLAPGTHHITLEVTDKAGESTNATIEIQVIDSDKPGTSGEKVDDKTALIIGGVSIVVIVVLAIIVLFILMKRKKEKSAEPAIPDQQLPSAAKQQTLTGDTPAYPQAPVEQPEYYPLPQQEQQYAEQLPAEDLQQDFPEQPVFQDVTFNEAQEMPIEQPLQEQLPYQEYEQPPEQQPADILSEQDQVQLAACPTCGGQIVAYTTPCPSCNTTLNWGGP